jgi:hypothetical protein
VAGRVIYPPAHPLLGLQLYTLGNLEVVRVWGLGIRVWNLGFGFGLWVWALGSSVQNLSLQLYTLGNLEVLGFGV